MGINSKKRIKLDMNNKEIIKDDNINNNSNKNIKNLIIQIIYIILFQ
jgi:hypothetical protein